VPSGGAADVVCNLRILGGIGTWQEKTVIAVRKTWRINVIWILVSMVVRHVLTMWKIRKQQTTTAACHAGITNTVIIAM
jgi:hypothetical protein